MTELDDPDVGPVARKTSSRHHHFDGTTRLARQDQRQRFQVNNGLAAKAAADLGWDGANIAKFRAGQLAGHVAHHEVALTAAPNVGATILANAHQTGVRLDIALMHGLGFEAALDDDVGRGEAGIAVPQFVLELAGDVRCRCHTRLVADAAHVLVQDGRPRLNRFIDVDHPGQDLVIDLDELTTTAAAMLAEVAATAATAWPA